MDIDRDHIDDAVLALLFLGRHDGMRTWTGWAILAYDLDTLAIRTQ